MSELEKQSLERRFIDLVSGKRRGLLASAARCFLWGLSLFYGVAIRVRSLAFDLGLRGSYRPDAIVISVGNLTTGGTGKTPVVAFLVRWLSERGLKVGILSRGYGKLNEEGNDEKRVLDRLCPGVLHLQSSNRSEIAREAVEKHGCQILVLDDGFQHRKLARDFDIVLIDATQPWGFGHVLPRGLLREPISRLKRAEFALITRIDSVGEVQIRGIQATATRHIDDDCIATLSFRPTKLINTSGELRDVSLLTGKRVIGFCGIGNPDSFKGMLQSQSIEPLEFFLFPDHHHYAEEDLNQLASATSQHNADFVVTTLKDLVKLEPAHIGDAELWAISIEAEFEIGLDALEKKLQSIIT